MIKQYTVNDYPRGYTTIKVLKFLWGRQWNDIAMSYVSALRPSDVVINYRKMDARTWRVHVEIDEQNIITCIQQEVEVHLPNDIRDGYSLDLQLDK